MILNQQVSPSEVWRFFEEICNIPHGSGNMGPISSYCVEFAKERGLAWVQDKNKNVILYKPGTKGYENAPTIILQGHMDMVCDKAPNKQFDFLRDGIPLCTDGEYVFANGTTLGADNGIAVAYCLAILDSKIVAHPPLEVVLTVNEETGVEGAESLDFSKLHGRAMINIDTEEEGVFIVSCAGGLLCECQIPLNFAVGQAMLCTIGITGLQGGHSGLQIDQYRGNANALLGRVLHAAAKQVDFGLVSLQGGSKNNAIPRGASAMILIDCDKIPVLQSSIDKLQIELSLEYQSSDQDIKIIFEKGEQSSKEALDSTSFHTVCNALMNFPNGVQTMSMDILGLVETSVNMGVVKLDKTGLTVNLSVRSSKESAKQYLGERIVSMCNSMGGTCQITGDYAGWAFQKDSPLRRTAMKTYQELFACQPKVEAIHAGLECGLFCENIKNLDCISFGPNIYGAHTFEEKVSVQSVDNVWRLLLKLLENSK